MTQNEGRHRGSRPQDRAGNIAAGIIAVAALGGAGILALQSRGDEGSHVSAAAGVSATSSSAAPAGSVAQACDDATTVYTSSDYVPALTRVVESYRTSTGASCAPAVVRAASDPGALAKQLPQDRASVWVARGAAEVAMLPKQIPHGAPSAVASTPVVLAMPEPLAAVWGWPTRPIMPPAWRSWLLGKSTWAGSGHPQWGNFSIASADPAANPTAAIGFGAMLSLANGAPLTGPPDYSAAATDPKALSMIKVEHRTRTTGTDDASVLPAPDQSLSAITSKASAFVSTEKAVADHNAQHPQVQLQPFPLGGGAASVSLDALRVGPQADQVAGAKKANDLLAYLRSQAGTTALRAAGLRAPDGTAPSDQPVGVAYAAAPVKPTQLDAQTVLGVSKLWSVMHTRISSMALIDASGSMNQKFVGTPYSRIDLVRSLVKGTYDTASPRARSGVWFFHTADAVGTPLIERATTLDVNESPDGAVSHATKVAQAIGSVRIKGGTPLYQAVRESYSYVLSKYDPAYVNQLVVLSDGANRDSTSPDQLGSLLDFLAKHRDPKRPVRIICLGYGEEADMASLQAIAQATGGRAAQVSSPQQMPAAVKFALFSL